jgi:hypothetical protein
MDFVVITMLKRRLKKEQVYKDGLTALALWDGGLAVYLSDLHGEPKTVSEARALLDDRKHCIRAMLRAVRDPVARKFLIAGLIELQSFRTRVIQLRSGVFTMHRLPIPPTDETN